MWIDYAVRQAFGAVGALLRAPRLRVVARTTPASFPEEGDTVISLTSHGPRLKAAVVAISSLLVGTKRLPVYLWLDKEDYEGEWPTGLRTLVDRGLQVCCSDGHYGPHTKYYGTFQKFAGTGTRVITVDDDMMYPKWFVEKLLNAADASPHNVVAYRAHEIVLQDGKLAPYKQWKSVQDTDPDPRHFATGVSGVAYPPAMVDAVAAQGRAFQDCAPHADDIWLNRCALRAGHFVRQVFPHPREFSMVPASQGVALVRGNLRGGNDAQLRATYTQEDLGMLIDAALSLNEPAH